MSACIITVYSIFPHIRQNTLENEILCNKVHSIKSKYLVPYKLKCHYQCNTMALCLFLQYLNSTPKKIEKNVKRRICLDDKARKFDLRPLPL